MRAKLQRRADGRRVRTATKKLPHLTSSVEAHRCAGRAPWRPDTTVTPLSIRRPGFSRARDASSDGHRKSLRRIGGEPRGEEGAGRVQLATLVTGMGEAMSAVSVVRV